MANVTKKVIWLASYPKSGNTWFRAFLTALFGNGCLDINEMKRDAIFSSRDIFEHSTDLDSTWLYDEEVKLLQPEIFTEVSSHYKKDRLFIKIHDAYILNKAEKPIVPAEPTLCALYFIRNPLDIVASLANHNGSTIDEAIKLMNDTEGCFARQSRNRNTNNQFRQLMFDWSGHVKSWTDGLPFPVMVIRYEDMLLDTAKIFKKAIDFVGLNVIEDAVMQAINESSFEKLKEKENKDGFREKNKRSPSFFRSGSMGNWELELTDEQAKNITDLHGQVMKVYDYL